MSIHNPVDDLLAWWLPRALRVFGDAMQSVHLYGSALTTDFEPAWSDVDVCVVVSDALGEDQLELFAELALAADAWCLSHANWHSAQSVDPVVIQTTSTGEPQFASLDPFDQVSLSADSVRIAGTPLAFPPPTTTALAARRRQFLHDVADPPTEATPIWHAAMIALIARALASTSPQSQTVVTKGDSLRRLVDTGGAHSWAFALARDVRRDGSASAAARAAELRRAFDVAARLMLERARPR